jgi:large repetitive protein
LTVRNQSGGTTLPSNSAIGDWSVEITLDVEWAHVIAPNASILLIEANSNFDSDLYAAVDTARNYSGVSAVSMSWGGDESSGDISSNSHFTTPSGHNGVTFLASSGDFGAGVEYPAASPNVVSVGGTSLYMGSGGSYSSEVGWDGSGGGLSSFQSQPSYQSGVVTQSSTQRAVPDVAMDSDPDTGAPIYDTYDNTPSTPWATYGGTSLASPMWAAVIAIANQGRAQYGLSTLDGPNGTLPKLYQMAASNFHDITTGNNGYAAGPGYDLVTGRGTPIVNQLVNALVGNPPTVAGLSPTNGPVSGGASVTIMGTNFIGVTAVNFGLNSAVSFTVNSATQITAISPAGGGIVDVTVVAAGGTSTISNADHYTYNGAVVTGVNPNNGFIGGGASVTITGSGFTGATAVSFGANSAATFTVNSDTQITATSPAGSQGVVDVTVTTPVGGTSAFSAADHFTYIGVPTVTGLNPTTGPEAGSISVIITGTNLSGASSVKFGTTNAASFTVNSATQITATLPAGTPGLVDVTVTTPVGGISAISSADQFTYMAGPTVTAVSPNTGLVTGGAVVTITGAGFTGAIFVKFGANNATTFTVNSDTQITATSPVGSGVVDVTVTIPVGGTSATSAADHFTYLGPVVTGLSPSSGSTSGGTVVTITGSGFSGATAVKFGATNAASFTVNSDTQIAATSPPGTGSVNITVTTPVATSVITSADVFTYSVVVNSNAASVPDSSTTLTINGAGFSAIPSNNTVAFNLGVTGTVTAATTNQLTLTLTSPPTSFGNLTAVVTANGISSGAPVQVATEVSGTWTVSSSSGSGGTLANPTLPYAVTHSLSGDQIAFAAGLSGATITLSSTLTISHNIKINGLGVANLAVSGNSSVEDFLVNSGVTATISNLTIKNGNGSGGGIQNNGTLTLTSDTITNNTGTGTGGGIYNTGTLTVINSTFTNNNATYGGGLASTGSASVAGCTFSGNNAEFTGGGILNWIGSMSISDSTIASNTTGTGGGISNYAATLLTLSNDTIANNTDTSGNGGGLWNEGGAITMLNTIIAGNLLNSSASDVSGTISLANNNIVSNSSGMTITSGAGNHLNVSAGLASSLANNGGPTQTIALLSTSIAMGNGGVLTSIATGHAVGVADVTIYVANASTIAMTQGNYYILIDQEQMLVTAVNTANNTLTVQRGVNGTTAATHAVGAGVYFAADQRGIFRPTPPAIGAFQLEKITSSNVNLPANSTSMTINGSAFDPVAANDTVAFSNGVTGVVTAATSTTLTISLTGLDSVAGGTALNASVTVDGVSSGPSVQVATVIPVITSTIPSSGPVSGGTSVTITGAGFTGATSVKFGANNATTFTVNSATQITAMAPPGGGLVDITVTVGGSTSATSSADQFTYFGAAVTGVSPNIGFTSGGTSVTITGSGFAGATAVNFGTASATSYTVNSDTQITAISPAGSGVVDVTVTTPIGGASATSAADQFTYLGLPTITAISPTIGPAAGGTSVIITGTSLTGATSVMFGTTNATSFTVNSLTQITATSPAGAGLVDVTVTTPEGGTSALSSADQFTYIAVPTVTGVSPNAGVVSGGTAVTITGAGFTGATFVKFGANNATTFTVNSDTQISATSPVGSGVVDVTVTIPVGGISASTAADHFTYVGPAVTGVSPSSGSAFGGTLVTIAGSGFTGATAVSFGVANAASFTVNSDTQITATSPPGAGSVNITVTTPVATSVITSADVFTFSVIVNSNGASVPDSSPTLTINGAGFSTIPSNNTVAFNLGVTGTVTAATANQLTVTITSPPTAFGNLTAVVTANGFSSGAPVQVATEASGAWTATSSSGGTGTFANPTLPYALSHSLSGDQITFASGLSGSTITLSSTLTISHNITITGLGAANLAVSGNSSVHDFLVNSGVTASISNLTIKNGHGSGGGIRNQGTLTLSNDTFSANTSTTSGGGVYNTGTLTVSNSTFTNNSANYGGGLSSVGTATLTGCTFNGNSASITAGGIVNWNGTLTLSNSTLASNIAETGAGIINYGTTAVLTLSNDTIAYNTDSVGNGAGVENYQGTVTMLNTIVAGNHLNSSANDVSGTIAVANNNVIGNSSGMTITSGAGNHLNVSAGLASALANNGGPTQTIALLSTSIAMNNGGALTAIATGHPVGVTDTTIYVTSAATIARTAGNYYILIGSEQILVTSVNITNNTLTVQRGVNGTTAASHAVGANGFFAMDQRGIVRPTPAAIGAFQLEQISSSTVALPANSTSMTISGSAFDPVAANDTVAFSNGVTGVVTAATSTTLTVSLTGLGSVAGGTALDASVTVDGVSSGSAVQVATVAPVVTASTASLPVTATSLTIAGFGFDTTIAHDSVTFDNGVTGSVTAATSTSLTVSLAGLGSVPGGTALHASATVNGASSGSAVQVATVDAITTQPSSVLVNATQNTSFTAATSSSSDSVQWQVNSGSGFTDLSNTGYYSGSSTPILNITWADTNLNLNQYRAVFTNGAGTLTTNAATLTVDSITTQPGSESISAGQDTSFTAATFQSSDTVQWQVDTGSGFTDLANGEFYTGVNATTLTITNADVSLDGARYQAVFTNSAGALTTTTASLTVTAAATTTTLIDNGPNPSTAGQDVSFTVNVSGGPAITGETVFIEDASNGFIVVASPTLANGTVNFTISDLPVGSHHLIAVYNGDANNASSNDTGSATPVVQVVNYSGPAPAWVSDVVNGGTPQHVDQQGTTLDISNQNSVVLQILVTFNEPVALSPGAFSVIPFAVSTDGNVHPGQVLVNSGAMPNTAEVDLNAPIQVGDGHQWIVTFANSPGTHPNGYGAYLIDDGVYTLHIDHTKVQANARTMAADNDTGFWALYGDVTYHQTSGVDLNVGTGYVGDGYSDASVGCCDFVVFKQYYNTDSSNDYAPPDYYLPLDYDLDGSVAASDFVHFKLNYNADWQF